MPLAACATAPIWRRWPRSTSPALSWRARCMMAACRARRSPPSWENARRIDRPVHGGRRAGLSIRPGSASGVRGKGVGDFVTLLQHLPRRRLARDRALDGEFRRLVVEILDLVVVARVPVNEDADT